MTLNDAERHKKLLELIQDVIAQDNVLRQTLQIGEKFRFIRDRLSSLQSQVEKNIASMAEKDEERATKPLKEDEVIIYIYLFNTHGLTLSSWKKMLRPELLYEYGINRPLYLEKSHVESLIRAKTGSSAQHGYISIVVSKNALIQSKEDGTKDVAGNPMIKVSEGALRFENLHTFTHNGNDYLIDVNGELVKKE